MDFFIKDRKTIEKHSKNIRSKRIIDIEIIVWLYFRQQ